VFDTHEMTEEICRELISHIIESVMNGIRETVFAYMDKRWTLMSYGKTFTMRGLDETGSRDDG